MNPEPLLPTWAPRVKQHLIRRLYESDAAGMLDEELLNEVGWALRARCDSFIAAVEASRGRARCPGCGATVNHSRQPDETLRCPACGWENTWQAYYKTFRHKQLSGADEVLALFGSYIERFPKAASLSEKMLLIDGLIHGFHYYIKFGNTRTTGVNLIDGYYHQVVEFLDNLSRGPESTPGISQNWHEWREEINRIAEMWKDDKLRRP